MQEKMHVRVTHDASADVRYVRNAISRDTGREVTTVVRAMGDLDQALVAEEVAGGACFGRAATSDRRHEVAG